MTSKKKQKSPSSGRELYESTKLPMKVYLEAAQVAADAEGILPIKTYNIFKEMAYGKAIRELTGVKP